LFAACGTAPTRTAATGAPLIVAAHTTEPTELATATALATPRLADDDSGYTIAKAGWFSPDGDIDGLDDGAAVELAFGRKLIPFLSIEGSIGYLSADGNVGSQPLDLWALPLFVNGRFSVPILVFEGFVGAGIGGMFVDYEATGLFSDEDFVFAGNVVLGAEVGLGGFAAGIEYKYITTEETKNDFSVEGSILSLFASLPF
jgi:hypothetical protein